MDSSGQVRIGLLGCGRIGIAHARALTGVPGAVLIGVTDVEPERAEAVARQYGATAFAGAGSLLESRDLDAVVIAVPTYLHASLTVQAVEAGKHVLCEKPMAMNLEQADRMIAAAACHGRVLMVGHDLRFSLHYRKARELVVSGALGRPRALAAERLTGAWGTSWKGWIARGGEGLGAFEALIHDLDVACWMLGPVEALNARGTRGAGGAWEHLQVLLMHADGASSMIEGSISVPPSFPFTNGLRIVGDQGTLIRRFVGGPSFTEPGTDTGLVLHRRDRDPQVVVPPMPGDQGTLRRELTAFVEAVRSGDPCADAPLEDARTAIALAMKVERAVELGITVSSS